MKAKNKKPSSAEVLLTFGLLALVLSFSEAQAGGPKRSKTQNQSVTSSLAAPPLQAQIEQIYESARSRLSQVEQYISDKNYAKARALARSITMDIKDHAGIETTTPEFIALPQVGITDWPQGTPFDHLSLPMKVGIAEIIKKHKSGEFLELLNLVKRSAVLYLKASYFQMRSSDQLKKRDIGYIRRSLVQIHSIPIYLKLNGPDPDESNKIRVVFDSDPKVVDEIKQYEFDRELLSFAVSELGYTEESFEQALSQFRAETEAKTYKKYQTRYELESAKLQKEKEDILNIYKEVVARDPSSDELASMIEIYVHGASLNDIRQKVANHEIDEICSEVSRLYSTWHLKGRDYYGRYRGKGPIAEVRERIWKQAEHDESYHREAVFYLSHPDIPIPSISSSDDWDY